MELSCPRCRCVHDVPEKAFLVWKRPCTTCGALLSIVTVERPAGNGGAYLELELHAAEGPFEKPLVGPPKPGANTPLC